MAKVLTPSEIATSNPAGEPTIRALDKRRKGLVDELIAAIRRAVRRSKRPTTHS